MSGTTRCNLAEQGLETGSCRVLGPKGWESGCQIGLKEADGKLYRLIFAAHLSRPENYFSIYQSGCNLTCRKCHSWYFSKECRGEWYSPLDIASICQEYEEGVTLIEPRERATAWHAHDTCHCCGWCVLKGRPSPSCPKVLTPAQITSSPQGWGPVRNIVGFTGGDLLCRPLYYSQCTRLIKERTHLWVLMETNGYGLSAKNLDLLKESGVDSFWLDIKAFDEEVHRWLTGCSNKYILKLPEEILSRGFILEVLSLYIPRVVETNQLKEIANLLAQINSEIPFTILAFFPEYRMKGFRSPTAQEMINAYEEVKAMGLKKVRLGNVGIFVKSEEDYLLLKEKTCNRD